MKTSFFIAIVLLGIGSQSAPGQVTVVTTPVAHMGTARSNHTATLLQDGRVLITGGDDYSAAAPGVASTSVRRLATTEIYDPVTQTFTAAGNMTTGRSGHTATLLPDGRVLIAGGDWDVPSSPGTPVPTGTAELYDPSTGSFTATGNLVMGQVGFNANLLANGKVLITGGISGTTESSGYVLGDVEVYDPSAGAFTTAGVYAGSLAGGVTNVFGFASTATLLPDSTVLFATEPASQVYNPVGAAFTLSGVMSVSNSLWGTFYPDYIAGRTANLLLTGKVLAAGGEQEDTGRFSSAELYDAASGVFVPTGSMTIPRYGHTATLLPDGTVLMTGGESDTCGSDGCWYAGTESSMELYDPVKGVFTGVGNLTIAREFHTATLLNSGDVLIAGGEASVNSAFDGSTASAELYHPASASPPPALFPVSGDGSGQGAIWHAATGQLASSQAPASPGEVLSMFVVGLAEGGAIPPQVAVGGLLGEILYFGDAPGYPGYSQLNIRVPSGVTPGAAVPVRLTYLGRMSNAVTIGVRQ